MMVMVKSAVHMFGLRLESPPAHAAPGVPFVGYSHYAKARTRATAVIATIIFGGVIQALRV
jgi:hypothetical protein